MWTTGAAGKAPCRLWARSTGPSVTQMSSLPLAFQVFAQILLPRLPFLGVATVQYSTRLSAFPTDYDFVYSRGRPVRSVVEAAVIDGHRRTG